MSDPEWVTYAEAAERLGISVEGVRLKVKRDQKLGRDAKLRVRRDNSGRMLLVWDDVLLDQRGIKRGSQHVEGNVGPIGSLDAGAIEALTRLLAQQHADHVAALAQQRADHKNDLEQLRVIHAAEVERLQDELQEAQAEADHAKADQVRMARDVATMFDELKALTDRHAELHADRARLQAGLERLQDERNRAVLSADQAQQEIKRQRDQANALLSQVEDLNGSLDQMRRERQAEVGRLRAELKQERIRWWHRWLKR
jgi:hypothetical protein